MAITKKHKKKLLELLSIKKEYSNIDFQNLLNVAHNWTIRNKQELLDLGFILVRSEKNTLAPRKIRNDKGKIRSTYNKLDVDTINLLDLKMHNYLLIKHYINKTYLSFGLIAPFQIEAKEFRKTFISSSYLDTIDNKIEETSFDYFSLLSNIITCEDPYNSLYITNFPVNITIYLKSIFDNIQLLQDIEVKSDTLLIINNTFKDLFGFLPSQEQIQVVAKSLRYASSDEITFKSVSVQSDAGSSKSCCAVVIQNILRTNLNPLIVAKTNKALVGMDNAKTIARFLQENVGLSVTKDTWEERRLKAFQKQDIIDFVIVDESSQVGELDRLILQTVCKKILFFGDKCQAKPIHDTQAIDMVFLHTLKHQYRFDNSEMIINNHSYQKLFTLLNKEKRREKLQDLFNTIIVGTVKTNGYYEYDCGDYVLKNDYSNSFTEHKDLLKNYDNDKSIIIAYSQNAVEAINIILNDGEDFKIGSKVSLKFNDYATEQFNGYQYRIIDVLKNDVFKCISIENGQEYFLKKAWLILSYAITTMKAQGSQWEHILGIDRTCPNSEIWTDRYVIITRASKTIKFLSSTGISNKLDVTDSLYSQDNSKLTIHSVLSVFKHKAKEGNRNNLLYGCYKDLIKLNASSKDFENLYSLAFDSGLDITEIDVVFNQHPNSINLNYLVQNKTIRTTPYFTPVFTNGKTLKGSDRTLSLEEASKFDNVQYIAEELKHSNRIVIDCDSKETVELFKNYLYKTESYINSDLSSAHLVFTTDKIIPTKHKDCIDLLGNQKFSLRNIKPNKQYNNNKAISLTQEVLDIFNSI